MSAVAELQPLEFPCLTCAEYDRAVAAIAKAAGV